MRITIEFDRPGRRRVAVAIGAALAITISGVALASHIFADVLNTNPFHSDIGAIAEAGITTGCGASNFCPGSNITREQEAAFLHRGLGRVAQYEHATPLVVLPIESYNVEVGAVTINVPGSSALGIGANQFVKIDAELTISGNTTAAGCPCNVDVGVDVDQDTAVVYGQSWEHLGAFVYTQRTLGTAYVFEASPGSHTYYFRLTVYNHLGPLEYSHVRVIATTYAFGATGGDVLGAATSGGGASVTDLAAEGD